MTRDSDAMRARKREAVEPRSGGSAAIAQQPPGAFMTDNTTLKPCECGGEAELFQLHTRGPYAASCRKCFYRPPASDSLENARARWNTRPSIVETGVTQAGPTQDDKDAAAIHLGFENWQEFYRANLPILRDGIELAEAFARHRQSTPLLEALKEARDALRAADQFITNGVDFGYITMPDPDSNDSALKTPSIVGCALQKLELMDLDTIIEGKG